MKIQFYLTVNSRGAVKTSKNRPSTNWDEITVHTNLTLPDAIFKKPQLTADILIPNEAAIAKVISAEVSDNVKDAIQQITGMEVKLSFLVPEEPKSVDSSHSEDTANQESK